MSHFLRYLKSGPGMPCGMVKSQEALVSELTVCIGPVPVVFVDGRNFRRARRDLPFELTKSPNQIDSIVNTSNQLNHI